MRQHDLAPRTPGGSRTRTHRVLSTAAFPICLPGRGWRCCFRVPGCCLASPTGFLGPVFQRPASAYGDGPLAAGPVGHRHRWGCRIRTCSIRFQRAACCRYTNPQWGRRGPRGGDHHADRVATPDRQLPPATYPTGAATWRPPPRAPTLERTAGIEPAFSVWKTDVSNQPH
jgi:hypothetical protein